MPDGTTVSADNPARLTEGTTYLQFGGVVPATPASHAGWVVRSAAGTKIDYYLQVIDYYLRVEVAKTTR